MIKDYQSGRFCKENPGMIIFGFGLLGNAVHSEAVAVGLHALPLSRIFGCDVGQIDRLDRYLDYGNGCEIIVNCIGATKAAISNGVFNEEEVVYLNSVFPQILSQKAKERGMKLIHISTDCVFSGEKGNYTEEDTKDATDLYGRSKSLGENIDPDHLVLRTSFVGFTNKGFWNRTGLFDWFINQHGTINGFSDHIYSGLYNHTLARWIVKIALENRDLHGIYQLSSEPINKYDLLQKLAERLNSPVSVLKTEGGRKDMSMLSTKLQSAIGFVPPKWDDMLKEIQL